jgi:5'-3' exonuclease
MSNQYLPIVIYDFRVFAHMVYNARESLNKNSKFAVAAAINIAQSLPNKPDNSLEFFQHLESNKDPELTSKWLKESHKLYKLYPKMAWPIILNRGPNSVDFKPHVAVIVDDNSVEEPYWRKQLFPDYKGNRSPKPDQFFSVAQQGLQYATDPQSPFYYIQKAAYEADDFAGAFVKIKRLCQSLLSQNSQDSQDSHPPHVDLIAEREIWLYTVDSDWLQLVGNGVTWFNTGPWEPRVRGYLEAIGWAKKRLKVNIQSPEQIVDTKMVQGDKSDNLPKGSPRYLIDLMNIHQDWEIAKKHPNTYNQMWFILSQNEANQRLDHYKKARAWFIRNQLPTPV